MMSPIIIVVAGDSVTPSGKAKKIYADRRARNRHLEHVADCFHDPAWDILLDLFVQEAEGRRTSITSACVGSSVAQTTALRIIKVLGERGALEFEQDVDDNRRRYVRLSQQTRQGMQDWLAAT